MTLRKRGSARIKSEIIFIYEICCGWFRESAAKSKGPVFSAGMCLRCYFIYDRPTFAVNSRDRIACSSSSRRHDRTRDAAKLLWNRSLAMVHADPVVFDQSKCIHPYYPRGYIYPLPIQINGLVSVVEIVSGPFAFCGRTVVNSAEYSELVRCCFYNAVPRLFLKALLFLSAKERSHIAGKRSDYIPQHLVGYYYSCYI